MRWVWAFPWYVGERENLVVGGEVIYGDVTREVGEGGLGGKGTGGYMKDGVWPLGWGKCDSLDTFAFVKKIFTFRHLLFTFEIVCVDMRFSSFAAAAALLATASAHGGVDVYTVGTTKYQG